jgi:anthraniloyl-CoA monooxygenase
LAFGQHYTSRAIGGLGLILTEMTAVSEIGRITLGCAGIYNENQIIEWKRITDFIHQNTQTKIGIQLGHSGRKGAI